MDKFNLRKYLANNPLLEEESFFKTTYKGEPVHIEYDEYGGTPEEPDSRVLYLTYGSNLSNTRMKRIMGSQKSRERRLSWVDRPIDMVIVQKGTDPTNSFKSLKDAGIDRSDFDIVPIKNNPLLKEDKQPTHRVITDVYFIRDYEGHHDDYKNEAVPAYELEDPDSEYFEDVLQDVLDFNDENFLYVTKGEEGWFDGEYFETESGSNFRLLPDYVEETEEDDEMWTDPAGGTHYEDEDDPAAAYIQEELNENKMKEFDLRKYVKNNPLLKERAWAADEEEEEKAIEIFVRDFPGKTRNDYFNLNDDEKEVLLSNATMELSLGENTKPLKEDDFAKKEYTEDEVKYSLGVEDDYEGWVDLAFFKGFEYDEDKDIWYFVDKDVPLDEEKTINEAQLQAREIYREIGYEVWYEPGEGYYVEGKDFIDNESTFEKYDEAVSHAEIEIDGYLEGTEIDLSSVKDEMEKVYGIDVDLDIIKDFFKGYNDGEGIKVFDTTEREDLYMHWEDLQDDESDKSVNESTKVWNAMEVLEAVHEFNNIFKLGKVHFDDRGPKVGSNATIRWETGVDADTLDPDSEEADDALIAHNERKLYIQDNPILDDNLSAHDGVNGMIRFWVTPPEEFFEKVAAQELNEFDLRKYIKNNPLLKENEDDLKGYWREWAAGEVKVGNSDVIDAGGVDADFGEVPNEAMNTFKDYVKAVKTLDAEYFNSKKLRDDIAGAVSAITFGGGDFEDYTFNVLTADQFNQIKDII